MTGWRSFKKRPPYNNKSRRLTQFIQHAQTMCLFAASSTILSVSALSPVHESRKSVLETCIGLLASTEDFAATDRRTNAALRRVTVKFVASEGRKITVHDLC